MNQHESSNLEREFFAKTQTFLFFSSEPVGVGDPPPDNPIARNNDTMHRFCFSQMTLLLLTANNYVSSSAVR